MKESRSALSIFVPPINTGHIWMAMSGASLVMRHAGNGVVQATFYVVLTQAMKKLIIYGSEKSCFRSRNLWAN